MACFVDEFHRSEYFANEMADFMLKERSIVSDQLPESSAGLILVNEIIVSFLLKKD